MEQLERWGEEIPASDVIDPVVFHFRPNKWVAVDLEHQAEFDRFFHEDVGFLPSAALRDTPAIEQIGPNGAISGSNGGWDD